MNNPAENVRHVGGKPRPQKRKAKQAESDDSVEFCRFEVHGGGFVKNKVGWYPAVIELEMSAHDALLLIAQLATLIRAPLASQEQTVSHVRVSLQGQFARVKKNR